ncbi:PPOX class F420-dependent oxidoreductase [Candidatus Chloroploca sp. M-50]|uniref:PPOX class F420-dependent oxidoreductase n=1 Tax=Candidatus Chloroploca mongolica TaxID=2528176 RepID=A0ABS4DHQ9_9CHLR|nr:PPOX class F420-dependent oxidoreductase [Candidatus Chloroploca mongolica]MBP1468981.1 PPOX class F420-dependent oxidoreductase [Candidatus Chloroploca mongolica]
MRPMTSTEARDFLLVRARTAKLATVRADVRPHVAPIWFDLEGDEVVFTTWHTSVKAANLRRDPRVSLCVDDDTPPFSFVIIEGLATLSEDPVALKAWAMRLGGRYMGLEKAAAYGARNSVPGELLVRIQITRLAVQAEVSSG